MKKQKKKQTTQEVKDSVDLLASLIKNNKQNKNKNRIDIYNTLRELNE